MNLIQIADVSRGVGIALVLLALGAMVRVFVRYRANVTNPLDQALAAVFVCKYDAALKWMGIRANRRLVLVDELRANIADAAADGPMRHVLRRIGDPRNLAKELEPQPRGPRWGRGLLVGLAVVVMGIWGTLLAADALMRDNVARPIEPFTAVSAYAYSAFLPGIEVEWRATADDNGNAHTDGYFVTIAPVVGLIPVGVGLLAAAPWRAGSRRRAATVKA